MYFFIYYVLEQFMLLFRILNDFLSDNVTKITWFDFIDLVVFIKYIIKLLLNYIFFNYRLCLANSIRFFFYYNKNIIIINMCNVSLKYKFSKVE